MQRTDRRYTPGRVKLLIVGAALLGLLLTVGQLVFFVVINPYGDFPNFLDVWKKIEVTYDNQTDSTAYVYLDDRLETTIPRHQSVTLSDRKIIWWIGRRVEVRDSTGRVIMATKLDADDLEKQHFRIEIVSQ